jgi:ribosomal protein S27E
MYWIDDRCYGCRHWTLLFSSAALKHTHTHTHTLEQKDCST